MSSSQISKQRMSNFKAYINQKNENFDTLPTPSKSPNLLQTQKGVIRQVNMNSVKKLPSNPSSGRCSLLGINAENKQHLRKIIQNNVMGDLSNKQQIDNRGGFGGQNNQYSNNVYSSNNKVKPYTAAQKLEPKQIIFEDTQILSSPDSFCAKTEVQENPEHTPNSFREIERKMYNHTQVLSARVHKDSKQKFLPASANVHKMTTPRAQVNQQYKLMNGHQSTTMQEFFNSKKSQNFIESNKKMSVIVMNQDLGQTVQQLQTSSNLQELQGSQSQMISTVIQDQKQMNSTSLQRFAESLLQSKKRQSNALSSKNALAKTQAAGNQHLKENKSSMIKNFHRSSAIGIPSTINQIGGRSTTVTSKTSSNQLRNIQTQQVSRKEKFKNYFKNYLNQSQIKVAVQAQSKLRNNINLSHSKANNKSSLGLSNTQKFSFVGVGMNDSVLSQKQISNGTKTIQESGTPKMFNFNQNNFQSREYELQTVESAKDYLRKNHLLKPAISSNALRLNKCISSTQIDKNSKAATEQYFNTQTDSKVGVKRFYDPCEMTLIQEDHSSSQRVFQTICESKQEYCQSPIKKGKEDNLPTFEINNNITSNGYKTEHKKNKSSKAGGVIGNNLATNNSNMYSQKKINNPPRFDYNITQSARPMTSNITANSTKIQFDSNTHKLRNGQVNKIEVQTPQQQQQIDFKARRKSDNEYASQAQKDFNKSFSPLKSSVTMGDYQIGKKLGEGAYAVVHSAYNKKTKDYLAMKIYDKEKILSNASRKRSVSREIKLLKKLDHPNIVKLYESIDTRKSLNLVMEHVEGISLYDYVKEKNNEGRYLSENEVRMIIKQLVHGLNYMHEREIAHRDLKLDNILLIDHRKKQTSSKVDLQKKTKFNEYGHPFSIKIIDFGFSVKADKPQTQFCGTPSYMAPEIVKKHEYNAKSTDIWALGILAYRMLYGNPPFKAPSEKELYNKIMKGTYTFPMNEKSKDETSATTTSSGKQQNVISVSQEAKEMIKKMLSYKTEDRPSAKELLKFSWMKQ